MEHIETKNSSDSQLQVSYTCSIRIVSINRDIDQTLNPTKAKRREYEFTIETGQYRVRAQAKRGARARYEHSNGATQVKVAFSFLQITSD